MSKNRQKLTKFKIDNFCKDGFQIDNLTNIDKIDNFYNEQKRDKSKTK